MVGAGTAGCTLAARLSENPAVQVLLIEAGPAASRSRISIPALYPQLLHSGLSWNSATEPQEHLNGRRLGWPRGKVLGGSGSLGAMIHLRGCRADFDAWRDLGNPEWGFDDLTPFWTDPPEDGTAAGEPPPPNVLTGVFLKACGERGIRRYASAEGRTAGARSSFEGPAAEGAGLYPVARVNHARWDATSAFLRPALKRGNLTVWTAVHATGVLFEKGRAAGVQYVLKGHRQQVQAAKETILCAGTAGSAQLLLLSGIGPEPQLARLGIPVAAASAQVGENLQDHPAVALRWKCPQPVSLDGTGTGWNTLRYRLRRQGPLDSNLVEAGACFKSEKDAKACDLEILFAPVYSLERGVAPPAEHGFTLLAALLTPESRGRVSLASANPLDEPRIDPCFLAEAADRERLLKGAARAREIAAAPAFGAYRAEAYGGASAEIEELVVSLNHGVGTCRMGSDAESVVDPELRVRGVEGLRVADASIMPVLPRTHPNATVMAIAEKAAHLILGQS